MTTQNNTNIPDQFPNKGADFTYHPQQPVFVKPVAPKGKAWRDITFGQAISRAFANFANTKGRASVREFWFWILFGGIVTVALCVISVALGVTGFSSLYQYYQPSEMEMFYGAQVTQSLAPIGIVVALFWIAFIIVMGIPTLAVAARRLHDINKSALLVLLPIFPYAIVVLAYFLALNEVNEDNHYNI